MGKARKKLIVIHGNGGNYADALALLETIIDVPVGWVDGTFYIAKPWGLAVRRLLTEEEPAHLIGVIQRLAVAHLLLACFEENSVNTDQAVTYKESRLLRDYGHLGIPIGPTARRHRAIQLRREALSDLSDIRPALDRLAAALCGTDGTRPTEADAESLIRTTGGDPLLDALRLLRRLPETGGDLDTVASCVFYAYAFTRRAATAGTRTLAYGRDYEIVFVNYHEPFLHLADYAPADLYMADLPIGALPFFERDIRELADKDIRAITYEDHHPYTQEQIDMLHRLHDEDLLQVVEMSGPLTGTELAKDDEKCASEMVYDRLIANSDIDCEAMAYLREITHAEDLATPDRQELGRRLTELIKGGVCKVDLAQRLTACHSRQDLNDMMTMSGWEDDVLGWREQFAEVSEKLWDNVYRVTFRRSEDDPARTGGTARGVGSDVAVSRVDPNTPGSDEIRVLIAHAYRPGKNEPKVPVGRVVEYFADHCPDTDYFFYCYGSSLCVTRRLNQADFEINLGDLMPKLGGPGDGGHAGAAVCRPEANPHYPTTLLRDVRGAQFGGFVRYLADRIDQITGRPLIKITDLSRPIREERTRGSTLKLSIVAAAAILIGAGLAFFHPRFDRENVIESNNTFFRQLNAELTADMADDATDPDAPPTDDDTAPDVQIFQAP